MKSSKKIAKQEQKDHENISIDNERALETNNETINQNNFDEDDKRQLIEENEALIEERIKKAENDAFLKGKETGLEEGKLQGISEAGSSISRRFGCSHFNFQNSS